MKKIIGGLVIVLILLLNINLTYAQTPSPSFTIPGMDVPIPGINCGDAEGATPELRQCCTFKNLTLQQKLDTFPEFGCILPGTALCFSSIPKSLLGIVMQNNKIKELDDWLSERANKTNPCVSGNPDTAAGGCICKRAPASTKLLCDKYVSGSKDYGACVNCASGGVWTAIGCIDNDLNKFITEKLLTMGIGLAGIIAILCIIYSAFMMQTSQGSPEKIKKAQELLTSCIMGLMLIIFSVFILRLIGINILGIPGFK